MKKRTRNTDFWSIGTPAKVGPGSYEISSKSKFRFNSAPFSKSELKPLAFKLTPSNLPGPGSYTKDTSWVKNTSPSSSFLSASPRTGPVSLGQSHDHSPLSDTPGPGAYEIETKLIQRPEKKHRQLSMIVEPTVSSIPYKPGEDIMLGPTSYNPDISKIKPAVISTNFAMSSVKRDMFDIKHNRNVGPGKYIVNPDRRFNKQSWVFTSKVVKNTEAIRPDQLLGPGSYNPKLYSHQPRVLVEGFGSTTERDILLTNDPHRPYANSDHSFQPLLADVSFQSSKLDHYRQKYLYPKTPIPKPGFGSSEKRVTIWANLNTIAGPGDYQLSVSKTNHSKFINKSPRFKSVKSEEHPGPGAYDSPMAMKNKVYINKAQRFNEPKNEVPESFLSHEDWTAKNYKQYYMSNPETGTRFGSSSPRFIDSTFESSGPGPGHYMVKEKKKEFSVIRGNGDRFSQHGSYIKPSITENEVGPGSYHKDSPVGKKTFNISPEIGDDRPWI